MDLLSSTFFLKKKWWVAIAIVLALLPLSALLLLTIQCIYIFFYFERHVSILNDTCIYIYDFKIEAEQRI